MPRPRAPSEASTTSETSQSHSLDPSQELTPLYDYLLKIILLGPTSTGKSSLLHRFVSSSFIATSQTIGVEFASKTLRIRSSSASSSSSVSSFPTTSPGYALSSVGSTTGGGGGWYGGGKTTRLKLQLWDTAGQERFRSVSRSYYRGAAGALLVYDVGRHESFAELETFLQDARNLGSPNLSVVLVGNKCDLSDPPPAGSSSATTSGADPFHLSDGVPLQGRRASVADARRRPREVTTETAARWAQMHGIPTVVETSALTGEGVEEAFERLARMILTKIELGEVDPDDKRYGVQYGDMPVGGVVRRERRRGSKCC
ncbi:ras-domain-containing protein [Ascobolus immersus RN42]|uniref:Ras-domain-containing protein n=1 Tax=Ascobolus immersus RN42 TaxID=1160509 RepID=A0A3N4HT80_ASCIM|nr:ras-domain-containing protein [Ascobolus immersus RN42]